MKEIFIKFNNFCEKYLSKNYNINFDEIKIILYIIIDYMQTDNNNSRAFIFFQKAELFSETFDAGIVLFMRYLIKEYLSLNENKYYRINIVEPIGSFLPKEYQRDGVYLFDNYYNNDLMKMNEVAENIAIIISPFVLNCDLNIFKLKYDEQNNMIVCPNDLYKSNGNSIFIINLIYDSEKMHYDLAYTGSFYGQYRNYFTLLPESIYPQFLEDQILKQQIYILNLKYISSNLTDDFLTYIASNSYISKILSLDKNKVENIIIKKRECVMCFNKDFKEAYFEFYCGCRICKEECFKKYIEPDEDDENKIYYDYFTKCPCGEEFNKKKVEEYLNNNENKDKEKYNSLIQAHWKWRCMICNETFNRRFRYYRLIFEEKCEFTKKKLEHLICFNCKNNIKKEKTIKCKFCDISHEIKSIRYVDEDNRNEPFCIII